MRKELNLLDQNIPSWKLILLLAWPAIVEQLLQSAVNYVDTAMVGSIGTYATAAVGVCTSTIWLLIGAMTALGVGYSVIVARRIGEGRPEDAREVIRQAMFATLVVGVALTALVELILAPYLPLWLHADAAVVPYAVSYFRIIGAAYLFNTALIVCSNILRCMGDTRTPLRFNLLTNVVNVVGNFLLIYPTREVEVFGTTFTIWGAGKGVAGAAAATALATTLSGVALVLVLFCRKGSLQIHLRDPFRPNPEIIRQAFRLGVPHLLERATITLGQIVTTAMITGLGTAALAAHQLANTGESLCYLPMHGFSMAATTLVAQNLGAKNPQHAFRQATTCTWLSVATITCTASLMFAFSEPIISIFSNDPEVIYLGARVLKLEAFAEPGFALFTIIAGVLRGAGAARWPFYISLGCMWLIRVPVSFLLIHFFSWGLEAVWVGMALDLLARGLVSVRQLYKKRWLTAWAEK